jgi:hypothetical protein
MSQEKAIRIQARHGVKMVETLFACPPISHGDREHFLQIVKMTRNRLALKLGVPVNEVAVLAVRNGIAWDIDDVMLRMWFGAPTP